jgi:hypothetical protein
MAPTAWHGPFARPVAVPAACRRDGRRPGGLGQVRSGQVYYSAEVQDHESRKAAYATSEVTSLESTSSYARIFRDDTGEPTTNVTEDHNDLPQATDLL